MGLEILYLLIPATFLLAVVALGLFVWAIHSGQFDDLETPAIRILFDDVPAPERTSGTEPHGPGPENGRSGTAPEQAPAARAERAASTTAGSTDKGTA